MINARVWYWAVGGSQSQVYSSATNTYVSVTDTTYLAWLAANGGRPTQIASEAELWDVLAALAPGYLAAWLFNGTTFVQPSAGAYTPAQLAAYAQTKQATVAGGGISVSVGGGVNVECSTDPASLVLLQGAYTLAQANSGATFQWVQLNGVAVTLTAAQIETIFTAVTTFLQATFTTLAGVLAGIVASPATVTTLALVNTPPSPIPAWPANS